jgi:hypothetical protein
MAHLSIRDSANSFISTTVSICSAEKQNIFASLLKAAENSDTLVSPLYSYKLIVGRSYKPPPLAKALSSELINAQSVLAKESGQSKDVCQSVRAVQVSKMDKTSRADYVGQWYDIL